MTEAWRNIVSPDAVKRAARYTLDHGGGTFAVPSLFPLHPTSGYAIGTGISVLASTPVELEAAIASAASIMTGRCCLGTWADPDTRTWEVEQTVVVGQLSEALRLGQEFGQRYIFDFRTGRSIPLAPSRRTAA